jgi:hypothetical protein
LPIAIDNDRNSPARVAAPYKFDLFGHYVEIIASMDNEKQRIVCTSLPTLGNVRG